MIRRTLLLRTAARATSSRWLASATTRTTTAARLRGGSWRAASSTAVRFYPTSGAGDSITYSGGQATEGQGGYYGSGGARVIEADEGAMDEGRSQMLALAADVKKIQDVMSEVETMESFLRTEEASSDGSGTTVTAKSIEIKSSIKKLMTSPDVLESLNRLEVQGQPAWGLSSEEREMIIAAREKVNEC